MEIDASLIARVLDLAVTIQQIPAPPFGEGQRAEFIRDRFHVEGLQSIEIDQIGNVLGCLPGRGEKKPLVVSAHLDTVFPFDTDLQIRREEDKIFGPGIGDNSLGVAGLFGLLWVLRERHPAGLAGDIWLAANVGEEGLGDLRGMRHVVQRFGAEVLAYIVLEGMALGEVYHRALGVRRFRVKVHTAGGHSWDDYGSPSAIHELAKIVAELTRMKVPSRPRSSLNVGVISGGTSVNTIASDAQFELDLRSEGAEQLDEMVEKVERIIQSFDLPGVKVSMDLIGRRPAGALAATHPLVQLAQQALKKQNLDAVLTIGSTDANIPLSQGIPGVTVGLTTGFGAHTLNEYVHTPPLANGIVQLVDLVEAAFARLG